MDSTLWKIFDTIDLLVRYAEGKNIHILTFLGLQLTAVRFIDIRLNPWLEVCSVFLCVSVLLCVASVLPKSRMTGWLYKINHKKRLPSPDDNILYYGDIVKYSVDGYIAVMEQALNGTVRGNKFQENLCRQIVINATIVEGKFRLFKLSFSIMLVGELFFVVSLFESWVI